KCPDWKWVKVSGLEGEGKVSGLEGGESVQTGRRGKCPDWKGVKVSGLEGGESVRT
ncbi:unnamed protein product, partial [Staurois parvus]